jgi:hypothetical protein
VVFLGKSVHGSVIRGRCTHDLFGFFDTSLHLVDLALAILVDLLIDFTLMNYAKPLFGVQLSLSDCSRGSCMAACCHLRPSLKHRQRWPAWGNGLRHASLSRFWQDVLVEVERAKLFENAWVLAGLI